VPDASSTVTFWPAAVVRVKPDADTLPTVPDAPPAAGPERALDPPPPDPSGPPRPLPAGPEPLPAAAGLLLAAAGLLPAVALTIP